MSWFPAIRVRSALSPRGIWILIVQSIWLFCFPFRLRLLKSGLRLLSSYTTKVSPSRRTFNQGLSSHCRSKSLIGRLTPFVIWAAKADEEFVETSTSPSSTSTLMCLTPDASMLRDEVRVSMSARDFWLMILPFCDAKIGIGSIFGFQGLATAIVTPPTMATAMARVVFWFIVFFSFL